MPPFDETTSIYPPIDLRPREAARLAERPCPPIAGAADHPDQWVRPYGAALPRLHTEATPHLPHRRA